MKTILCYGDSNTWGAIPKRDLYDARRYALHERWTGVMRQELGSEYWVVEEGLRGRTTVFDDPIDGSHRNGLRHLLPCLQTHAPLDLIVVMLGTNDLKKRFSVSALDIALGMSALITVIKKSDTGPTNGSPQILIIAPPPLVSMSFLAPLFEEGEAKSRDLSGWYRQVALQQGCAFFDSGEIITSSGVDGVHFDLEDHQKLGFKLANVVQGVLDS